MSKEINGFFNRIYENFFMRDLTYIFGGSILLASTYHVLGKNLFCAIEDVTQNPLKFLILISVTYLIGLIVQEGFLLIPFINKIFKASPELPEPYKSSIVFRAVLSKKFGAYDIQALERTIYLKHLGLAIGTSSIISVLISLVFLIWKLKEHETSDFIIFGVLIVLMVVCIGENRMKFNKENAIYKEFLEYIVKNESSVQGASGGSEASQDE